MTFVFKQKPNVAVMGDGVKIDKVDQVVIQINDVKEVPETSEWDRAPNTRNIEKGNTEAKYNFKGPVTAAVIGNNCSIGTIKQVTVGPSKPPTQIPLNSNVTDFNGPVNAVIIGNNARIDKIV